MMSFVYPRQKSIFQPVLTKSRSTKLTVGEEKKSGSRRLTMTKLTAVFLTSSSPTPVFDSASP